MEKLTEKMIQKLNSGREYRNMVFEAREASTDERSYIVEGYATTFNEAYTLFRTDYYTVNEVIDSKAFNDCDMSDCIMQYNHEGRVFARCSNNTLSLSIDEHGLFVRADLGGTETGRQLYEEIKGGYTNKMSFGFIVSSDNMNEARDHETGHTVLTRTITGISKLFDVSAVSIPANDMTEISARGFSDGVIKEIEAERLKRAQAKEKLALKLKIMEV